jgi:hypothetical protein
MGVVGIATSYGLDDRGVEDPVSVGSRVLFPPRRLDRLWGPPSLLYDWNQGLFPRVKWQRREADHLLPRSRKCESIQTLSHMSSWCSA